MQKAFQGGGGRMSINREQMEGLRSNINYSVEKDKTTQKLILKTE